MRVPRRPSTLLCPECGRPAILVDCGVREHRRPRPRQYAWGSEVEQCNGRIYVCEQCEEIVYPA